MGRGDKRTEKGKRARGSFGNVRSKSGLKARAIAAKAAPKTEEKPAETTETPEATA
ncbi:MAG: 30S ribosomal protein THX [Planctomycetota bacterium]|nr:MAG: 30S ribosomal protein THX [Planctomycetota bacterium]